MSTYSSREPFNDDPYPYQSIQSAVIGLDYRVNEASLLSRPEQRQGYTFKPRPEYDRPQNNPTNPILTEFRRSAPWDISKAAAIEVRWLSEMRTAPVPATATYALVDHARKVLTRLAALKEES